VTDVALAAPAAGDGAAGYRRALARRAAIVAALAAALLLATLTDISLGPSNMSFAEIGAALAGRDAPPRHMVIVWDIRLPMALTAVLVGALLGVAGAQMQTILGNPLAEPFTLGISSAASVGAALGIVLGLGLTPGWGVGLITVNAFVFALAAAGFIFLMTRLQGVTPDTMILFGIAQMFTFNALLGLLQYRASETQLTQIVFWMLGSLARASWEKLAIAALIGAVVLPLMWRRRWQLTAIRTGDERAASLGVDVQRLRLEMLVYASLLSATAVAFVGVVGFIGLVGPHIARMLMGEDQRWFLPASALAGALILSLTSTVSKSIVPGVVYPIGIITALIGVPFFLSLILAQKRIGA
jgi:iron complex transport system permease protein